MRFLGVLTDPVTLRTVMQTRTSPSGGASRRGKESGSCTRSPGVDGAGDTEAPRRSEESAGAAGAIQNGGIYTLSPLS